MSNPEPLNFKSHGRVRMKPAAAATAHFVQVFDSEFAVAATRCPVLFTKNAATGGFYAGAMFGFKPGERLADSGADDGFRPLVEQCEGFLLHGGGVVIDRAHRRFSDTEGDLLFDEGGDPTAALRQIQRILGNVHAGLQHTQSFIEALRSRSLIEHIDVTLSFDDGERLTLQGLYTVSLDRLRDVDDRTMLDLCRPGHLQLAYLMAASLKQIDRLARVRNSAAKRGSPG
jgi:hypothetical protein